MIVKNESKVIHRCLDSVSKYLDYWVICDTGSTDNTKNIIKSYFEERKIPGELLEHEWKNFGHNRSLAVQSAQNKADYLLLMDADFVFKVKDTDFKKKMTGNGYLIKYEGNLDYRQLLLVSGKHKWVYVGVTHEYIHCPDIPSGSTNAKFDGFTFHHLADGGERSNKFTRDIELLEQGLKDEPNNSRYMFYLAQSYKDSGKYDQAIKWYSTRIEKGGWNQENYYSRYQKAICLYRKEKELNKNVIEAYLDAYNYRPSRLEALHDLIRELRLKKRYTEGFRYGIQAYGTPYPGDVLFIDKAIHDWKFNDELSLVAYYCGHSDLAKVIYDRMFAQEKFPQSNMKRALQNYKFYTKAVGKMDTSKIPTDEKPEQKVNQTTPVNPPAKKKEQKEGKEGKEGKNEENVSNSKAVTTDGIERKVAIVIVNENQKKETEELLERVSQICKYPHRVILVDNCSRKEEQSEHTEIYLRKQRVGLCNAWRVAMDYTVSLEEKDKKRFYAYFFLSPTVKILSDIDFVRSTVTHFTEREDVVGVHPALQDTVTDICHLVHENTCRVREVQSLGLNACYRASWLTSIGGFEQRFVEGDGTNLEFSCLAKVMNYKLLVDGRWVIQDVPDIKEISQRSLEVANKKYNCKNFVEFAYNPPDEITICKDTDDLDPLREPPNFNRDFENPNQYLSQKRERSDKVAIIITNYNMIERANNLVKRIGEVVKHPHEVILVDNGSDKVSESESTHIALRENVQACNGWLTGLSYADAMERLTGKTDDLFFAYCFVITSSAVKTDDDFIERIVRLMKEDPDVVGVHPSLTDESTTSWTQHIKRGGEGVYEMNMMDNIFSCYRASWFNQIGRFDRRFTYGWGIDIETSTIARRQKKKLLLDCRSTVEKITNIGYTMNRMSENARSRHNNANDEMNDVTRLKYNEHTNSAYIKFLSFGEHLRQRRPYTNESKIRNQQSTE